MFGEDDEDELELELAELPSPSGAHGQYAADGDFLDEEIGDDRMLPPAAAAARSQAQPSPPQRSPISSMGGSGHLHLTTLYSGVHNGNEDNGREASVFGATDEEVMEDPVSRYGPESGALHNELMQEDDAQHAEGGRCQRFKRQHCEWMESKHTRVRMLLICLLLAALWIPIIYIFARPSSGSNSSGAGGNNLGGHGSTRVSGTPAPWEPTPLNTLIAYVGDVSVESYAATGALYDLIRRERAQALVIQGDLDYTDAPEKYDALLSKYFGDAFPVFPSAGNHDKNAWPGYSRIIAERWRRGNITTCAGLAGEAHVCTYKGIVLVQIAPGVFGSWQTPDGDALPFLNEQLQSPLYNSSRWLTCSFHKNQVRMQLGGKDDDVGWPVYERCREAGALIATGHEHSWARTYLLDGMETAHRAETSPPNNATFLPLAKGRSVVFCNGLGGRSVRKNTRCNAGQCPWFASMEASKSARPPLAAALFCSYNDGGNINRTRCYLKAIAAGDVVDVRDEFVLDASAMPQTPPPKPTP